MPSGHNGTILDRVFDNMPALPPRSSGDDRRIRPPKPVWVDLAMLHPATGPVRPYPEGWDLQSRVPGELSAWLRDTLGQWFAEVRFRVRRGDNTVGVWHTWWVPAAVVSERVDSPARPD